MTRILTVTPENANRFQRLLLRIAKRQSGGFIPGISKILLVDMRIARPTLRLTTWPSANPRHSAVSSAKWSLLSSMASSVEHLDWVFIRRQFAA